MDMVDLDRPGPWPGTNDDDQAVEVDWSAVEPTERRGDDLVSDSSREVADGGWERTIEDVLTVARRGFHTPPPDILDAQAWYLPVHYFGPESAIYIRERAVLDLAGTILGRLPERRRADRDAVFGGVRAGLAALYLHEAFHHKIESLAIRLEIVEAERRYIPYHDKVFSPLREAQSDDLVEEALACAEMHRRLKSESAYKRHIPGDVLQATLAMLPDWFRTLPAGYRTAGRYLTDSRFNPAMNRLTSQLQEARENPRRSVAQWNLAPRIETGLFNHKAITHIVIPVGAEPIVPWFGHGAVPLPVVSSKAAVEHLRRGGYEVVPGGKGSHIKLRRPGGPMQIVPANRKALSPGVIKTIADGLGVRPHDLFSHGHE